MNLLKILAVSFCLLIVTSCGSGNQKPSSLFTIVLEGNAKQVNQNGELGVSIKNIKNKEIQNVIYSIDGNQLKVNDGKLNFSIYSDVISGVSGLIAIT